MIRRKQFAWLMAFFALACNGVARSEPQQADFDQLLQSRVLPLVHRYCADCHSGERAEAEIDLTKFHSVAEVRHQPQVWLKVREVLQSRQMPPPEAEQPGDEDYKTLSDWTHAVLRAEAESRAGDPGPVILRRLTNSEYNAAIQDLTGVDDLDPTQEFPVDGAAGEGFTNTGSAQSMSPSLVTKYLDAARLVASHAMLLPDGIRFSPFHTQRDQTDQYLRNLRIFYGRYTEDSGASAIDLQGIALATNEGGRLPVQRYLEVLLQARPDIRKGTVSLQKLAEDHALSARYLTRLWNELERAPAADGAGWSVFSDLQQRWHAANATEAASLAEHIRTAQSQLWKFNTIGHVGRTGGPTTWMEASSPVTARQEFRIPLTASNAGADVSLWLCPVDAGRGGQSSLVVWEQPRLEYPAASGRSAILLKDAAPIAARVRMTLHHELPATDRYLQAVAEMARLETDIDDVHARATQLKLNPVLLQNWARLCGITTQHDTRITGHLSEKLTSVSGQAAINGWGFQSTSLLTNRSNDPISFLTLTVPARGVTVHPTPDRDIFVAWQSPVAATVQVSALIADADGQCGNGAAWQLEHTHRRGTVVIDSGSWQNGGQANSSNNPNLTVQPGDVIALVVDAANRDHVCDTTQVELTVAEQDGSGRTWTLSRDIVDSVLDGNPLPDSLGNPDVWHFGSRPWQPVVDDPVPSQSALANWRAAIHASAGADITDRLVQSITALMSAENATEHPLPDQELRSLLLNWHGPLDWIAVADSIDVPLPPAEAGLPFGVHPHGQPLDPASLVQTAGDVTGVSVPRELAAGAEFVVSGSLSDHDPDGGCVQLRVLQTLPDTLSVDLALPILATPGSAAAQRLEAELQRFRLLFPAALCYQRIVPVDEVVTLTLFYREDDHLKRLMLTESEIEQLDRMWEELRYVSREPIALTVAFEQLVEFATQDRPDLVTAFESLREPINARAERFRQQLRESEPLHLAALVEFATRAWRRPLTTSETDDIQTLYRTLRDTGLSHEDAIQRSFARILTSPAFLYRGERAPDTAQAVPVSDLELASRLSFFLWSSIPDDELRQLAAQGGLSQPATPQSTSPLLRQTHRMLQDDRIRRLAVHFACQWLHVRDFDQHNDKNEQLYPEFQSLRGDMYEETVLFFEDLFRRDGSILEILSADYAFLNEPLAKHYQIDGVQGSQFRRVDGMTSRGRGGILGMSTILASQSGASRTSPILRGNWVSETLLGERLPRPPANVPQLPDALPTGLTARQLIEHHSGRPECARCHQRIDPFGFALEGFDTIGRTRAGSTDTSTVLPDGTPVDGLQGLRTYLTETRRTAFVHQFCRKLLGYALGREIQLSDEPLLDAIQQQLADHDYRVGVAVDMIVTSDQFRNIRGRKWPAE